MKVGIIGLGSIGKRHVKNLLHLGITNIVLFRSVNTGNEFNLPEIRNIDKFLSQDFDFVLIANPTSLHFDFLKPLILSNKNILVEKPIVSSSFQRDEIRRILKSYTGLGMVAFNMRFHPCYLKCKELIKSEFIGKVYYSRFFVGQFLPDWRPNTDYRQSYSAQREMGGGVALDLIHEIDMAIALFGKPKKTIQSILTKVSDLEIETEDIAEFMYHSTGEVVVLIHLDYLYRGYKRTFEIVGEKGTIHGDLFKPDIHISGDKNQIIFEEGFSTFERNEMYLNMMRYYLECINLKRQPEPSLEDGLYSLDVVLEAKNE